MIFLTIGTQEPFDRLIKVMDEIAGTINETVIAQISNSSYKPINMQVHSFLTPIEFERIMKKARVIISHAGMGSIISALQFGKPIIIMPRIAKLGEHRNEHQMATAKKMADLKYALVAFNETELKEIVKDFLQKDSIKPLHNLNSNASGSLIASIKEFINKA